MQELHKVQVILSRSSTTTEEEVEDVVQAKEEVVAVATRIKVSSRMIHKDRILEEEDSTEVGGVKEVAKNFKGIMQEMRTGIFSVGTVEEQVTLSVTVHQGIKETARNKTTTRQPVGIMMNLRGCL